MMLTFREVERSGLGYDIVDDLTGKKLGRASSATFRTADVVGLDTMAHVIKTLQNGARDDVFSGAFETPAALTKLLELGNFGQKTKAGFFKKVGKDILQFNAATGEYVAGGGKCDKEVAEILKKPAAERLKGLRESTNPQAQFVWAILRNGFHYAAVTLESIAESARDIDFAMRWGFGASKAPLSCGKKPAGSKWLNGCRPTSTRARPCRRPRCPPGCSTAATVCTPPKVRGRPRLASTCPCATCPSTSVSTSAKACWAPTPRTPPPRARPCSKTPPSACGPWTTKWSSLRSSPRCTPSAKA